MKKKINLLPNVITAFALCCGLFAIFKMTMTEVGEVTKEVLTFTTAILLLAAIADLLDGAVARAMKVESDFGGFFDSMSDAICFGVAPSVMVLKSLSLAPKTEMSYLLTAAAMIFSTCGVLRLVRFNVMRHQSEDNPELALSQKKHFTGLPIPAAAAALISLNLFLVSNELTNLLPLTPDNRSWILFSSMLLLGYLMVSRWKFLSLKTLHIRVRSFQQIFFIVGFTVFVVFYGFMQHFSMTFLIIAWAYVFIAWGLSIIRAIIGKRAAALEEFEPDQDDLEEN